MSLKPPHNWLESAHEARRIVSLYLESHNKYTITSHIGTKLDHNNPIITVRQPRGGPNQNAAFFRSHDKYTCIQFEPSGLITYRLVTPYLTFATPEYLTRACLNDPEFFPRLDEYLQTHLCHKTSTPQ